MTQYPPGGQYPGQQPNPLPYNSGGYAVPPPKPGSITTVAVLAIIIGSLGTLCCGAVGILGSAANMMGTAQRLPDGTAIKADPGVTAFGSAVAVADLVTSIALLACGIGALSLKPWARSVGVMTSLAMIVIALVYIVGTITYTGPKTEEMFKQMEKSMASTPGGAAPPNFAKLVSSGTIGVGILIFLLRIIVPILILMLWTKPHIKAWFEGNGVPPMSSAPPPSGYGGYPPQ